jgi:hypothetical protein
MNYKPGKNVLSGALSVEGRSPSKKPPPSPYEERESEGEAAKLIMVLYEQQ